MTFLGDEGRDVLVVKRMIVDHKFTLLGPTASVGGFFLGPIYYYFMLPFLWAWNLDPTGPAVMVALFGIATIYLVFRAGKDMFNPATGLIAAGFYALSPMVIAYSRSSWNPNLVPFFSLLVVYLLWRIVRYERWGELFWVGVFLGIGLQLHYLFLFLFALVVLWCLLYGRSRSLGAYYVFGIAGFFVGYGPFLAFEFRHGFPNTQSVMRFLLEGKDTGFSVARFFSNIHDIAFRLYGRLLFRFPQPEVWAVSPLWQKIIWFVATYGALFGSIGMLLRKAVSVSKEQHLAPRLLLYWFFVLIFLFGMYKRAIYDYYFGIFFTLPFLATGFLLSQIAARRVWKIASVGLLAGLVYVNWQGRPFLYPPNDQLGQAKAIAGEAIAKTGGKPFNFALITGNNSDHAYRYFFEIWGNSPVTIQNVAADPRRATVMDQLIVICEISPCKPLGHPLWEIAGFGRAEIVGEWDVSFVKIMKLVHWKESSL
ncbi:glycosyltransferase family 39 protein [Candidatus Gottesmanbacteria bacterium]|nr:glycosyltransferase family 39 protein [Candidatus Gottesmanbacteria bacterium]